MNPKSFYGACGSPRSPPYEGVPIASTVTYMTPEDRRRAIDYMAKKADENPQTLDIGTLRQMSGADDKMYVRQLVDDDVDMLKQMSGTDDKMYVRPKTA